MLVFLDTSALLKCYVTEAHSNEVRALTTNQNRVYVSMVTWAEFCAALARRLRENDTLYELIAEAKKSFTQDWKNFNVIDVAQPLVEMAGDCAVTCSLRGFDSIQLASAKRLQTLLGESVTFACFDRKLNAAAKLMDLQVLDFS